MTELLVLAGVLALLVAVNGLLVVAEFALIGVRPTRIEQLAAAGSSRAARVRRVLRDRGQQDRYLATTQLGITAASLGLGMVGEERLAGAIQPWLAQWGAWAEPFSHAVAVAVAVAGLTFLHVVFGEMVPKSIALRYPEASVLWLARPMSALRALLAPLVELLSWLGGHVLRWLRIPAPAEVSRVLSAEELAMVIEDSAEGGILKPRHGEMLLGIIDFAEREVYQVMTPRTRIVGVAVDTPPEPLLAVLAGSRHTRFPVYEGNQDHIIGVLHLKDYVRRHLEGDRVPDLRRLARPALLVPEHLAIERLLAQFKAKREHMAIVIDEFGGTAGLVTLEDLVEEVVGEVRDEFDVELPRVRVERPGVLEVVGALRLDELAEYVDLPAELPDVDTVGGLVVTLLGRPATAGDRIEVGDLSFTVKETDGLAVALVRVEQGPH
jgi:CBS domain containing-hemolysin-like protein